MYHVKNNHFPSFFILCLIFFFIIPTNAEAHIGGGPPFLIVNGKYAQTNPYYQQEITTLNIPQDAPPQSYLVKNPITLSIAIDQLTRQTTIPSDMVKDLSFRWSVFDGDNFDHVYKKYDYGKTVSYLFKSPKSYLVVVEAKTPIDDDYIVIDTVQLNILPALSYKLPKLSVFIGLQHQDSQKPVMLVAQPQLDKTAKAKTSYWDFGDSKLVTRMKTIHTFDALSAYNTRMIYSRTVDSNGFSSDIGFAAENYEGKIQFVPFGNMKNVPVEVGTYQQAEEKSQTLHDKMLPVILLVVGILGIIFFLYKKQNNAKY